jgi:hypothetical protein
MADGLYGATYIRNLHISRLSKRGIGVPLRDIRSILKRLPYLQFQTGVTKN